MELAEYLRDLGYMPEQVQDFYPTPSTLSTCMYYTGYDLQDHGKGLCTDKSAREGDAESINTVQKSEKIMSWLPRP